MEFRLDEQDAIEKLFDDGILVDLVRLLQNYEFLVCLLVDCALLRLGGAYVL
jgi:hypothetical protein